MPRTQASTIKFRTGIITFTLPGSAGSQAWIRVPAGTITGIYITGDISGSAVVDLWKDTFANFPPTDADSITSATPPTLTAAQTASDTTLTGWTKTMTEGDILKANVDSASTLNTIVVVLTFTRS